MLAAVIIPVVLLIVALALTTLVWGASETEAQRASDQAALTAAAAEVLVPAPGVTVPGVGYPTAASVVPASVLSALPSALTSLASSATACPAGNVLSAAKPLLDTSLLGTLLGTLGVGSLSSLNSALTALSTTSPSLASALQATATCSAFTVTTDQVSSAYSNACATAKRLMAESAAPYSIRFFGGTSGTSVPDCDSNKRVVVSQSSQSPLLGLTADTVSLSGVTVSVPGAFSTIQGLLDDTLGIHLDSALPNTICPQVSVAVDQPVKGVVFSQVSTPNGRSTARRVIKNAVVVPVFNGVSFPSPTGLGSVGTQPLDLNSTVLNPLQKQLVGALDALDTKINSTLATANPVIQGLNGTLSDIPSVPGVTSGAPSVSVDQFDLLKCVTETVSDLYNPPSGAGSAATVQDVLANAAASGDPVELIRVGVQPCAAAVTAIDIYRLPNCIQAAGATAANAANKLTGLYDVPFLDVTSVVIKQVGTDPTNYQALAVDATQASGAFRSVLVRSTTDSTGRAVP